MSFAGKRRGGRVTALEHYPMHVPAASALIGSAAIDSGLDGLLRAHRVVFPQEADDHVAAAGGVLSAVDLPLELEPLAASDAGLELTAIALVCSAIGALFGGVLALVLGRATQLPGAEGVAVLQSAVGGTLLCAAAGATACGLFGTLIGWHLSGMPVPLLESDWDMLPTSVHR
jgi:hypothetical protein